jgi:pSer/pThr/pTyr-binding forkhead associated (FHA) protein
MNKLVLTGLTHPGEFELEPGFNTLGRNPTNDYRVHDATVSSFHCEIVLSEDSVLVRDLGSTNGTFIDNQPVTEGQLKPGQILRLGSAELRLESQAVPEPVEISVPELKVEPPLASGTLPDGSLSCLNHHDARAIVKCVKCEKAFCEECVHVLRLTGGKRRVFCPACSGHCEPLPGAPASKAGQKKRLSLLGRLTQTIRIRLK